MPGFIMLALFLLKKVHFADTFHRYYCCPGIILQIAHYKIYHFQFTILKAYCN